MFSGYLVRLRRNILNNMDVFPDILAASRALHRNEWRRRSFGLALVVCL